MKYNISDLVHDVVASPLGDVIASVGEGVAEAQQALDEGSLAKTLEIYSEAGEDTLKVLRDIGYRPTFYALPETTGEVRVSLHLGKSANSKAGNTPSGARLQPAVAAQFARVGRNIGIQPRMYATPVDAGYANRYGYQANISAKLSFKIVPVPAPEGADELRVVPNLINKTMAESITITSSLGFEITVKNNDGVVIETAEENAKVIAQEPHPDSTPIARLGDEIVLTI